MKNLGQELIQDFIDRKTRRVWKAWISNAALYDAFLRWAPWNVQLARKLISFQSFGRYLGHNLGIPTIRRWVEGRQVYGRRLWPLEDIRKHLAFGVDFI